MIATAVPMQYERALTAVLKDEHVDSAIVIYISPAVTGSEEIARAVVRARSADPAKPVLAVFMGSEPAAELLKPIPTFVFPESAVAALARAARYGEWRSASPGQVPDLPGIDLAQARRIVAAILARGGGWAQPAETSSLFTSIGIPIARGIEARSESEAVVAAGDIGYPVALKAFGPDILHKTERKAIALDLHDEASVRATFQQFESSLGAAMVGVYVQEMATGGIEMLLGAVEDPAFGPVVACGFGGTLAEFHADTAFRVAPLTDVDATAMIETLRCSRLLAGYRGAPAGDIPAVKNALHRLSALVTAIPEIREIEVNPLRVFRSGVQALDMRVRVEQPAPVPDSRRVEY
jgi:acyl-CoA synthetase (NDP forming)